MRTSIASMKAAMFAIFLFLFLLPTAGEVAADVLYLKNGRTIVGKVVGQTRKRILIRENSRVVAYSKRSVRKISYNVADELAILRAREKARKKRKAAREKARETARKNREAARLAREQERLRAIEAEKRRREEAREARKRREDIARKKREAAARKSKIPKRSPRKPVDEVSSRERLWRSAVLPGWGMLRANRPRIGYTYMGVTMGSFLYALTSTRLAASARTSSYAAAGLGVSAAALLFTDGERRLAAAALLSSGSTANYRTRVRSANSAFSLFAVLYLAQLAHSYFLGPGIVPRFAESNQGKRDGDVSGKVRFELEIRAKDNSGITRRRPVRGPGMGLRMSVPLEF